jgi:magnesium-transporting ATPase (P-type)
MTDPVPFHAMSAEAALSRLVSAPGGLSRAEARARLAWHGPNRLPEARHHGPILRFLAQFNNILIYVLLGAATITATLRHWVDPGVILAVGLANAVIGFIQEGKAEAATAAIRQMLAPHAAVLRDGEHVTVDAADLLPADPGALEARGLSAQEAILTGESVPVGKVATAIWRCWAGTG